MNLNRNQAMLSEKEDLHENHFQVNGASSLNICIIIYNKKENKSVGQHTCIGWTSSNWRIL